MTDWDSADFTKLIGQDWKQNFIQFKDQPVIQASEKYLLTSCHTWKTLMPIHCNPMTEKIFETFPYADAYAPPKFKDIQEEINYRKNPPPKEITGNLSVRGNGTDQRFVINMFTQDFPRAPTAQNQIDLLDSYELRFKNLQNCLEKVYKIDNLHSVAFPEQLLGYNYYMQDNWKKYLDMVEKYAKKYPSIKTVMYVGEFIQILKSKIKVGNKDSQAFKEFIDKKKIEKGNISS